MSAYNLLKNILEFIFITFAEFFSFVSKYLKQDSHLINYEYESVILGFF